MKFYLCLSFLIFTAVSCGEKAADLDLAVFSSFGKTLFSQAEEVSIKEVHLDHASLDEKTVIISGNVSTVGEYNTYVVLEDATARVLVIQTKIASFDDRIKEEDIGKKYKVLGRLITRKKGLPTIEAQSVVAL